MKHISPKLKKYLHTLNTQSGRITKFILVALFLFILPAPNQYFIKIPKTYGIKPMNQISLPAPPLYPRLKTQVKAPQLTAAAVLVKDLSSGVTLYAFEENQRFFPASTTKIMTALVALENYTLDDVVTVNNTSFDGRVMNLIEGEKLTVESLLYGALVHSANDAAFALADHYQYGLEQFVEKMNEKARKLHLSDTHFTNPVGYDDLFHYSTASDLSKQAIVALSNKTFAKIVGTRAITVSDIYFSYFHDLKNVNELLGKIPGLSGVKTGFTESGGEILISEVKKNGHDILIVLLKSADRFGETTRLIDWIFGNFEWVTIETVIPTSQ